MAAAATRSRPSRKSPTSTATRKDGWKPTPAALASLGQWLPDSWVAYFKTRPAGNYLGLVHECPFCHERPPKHLKYGYRRSRWLMVHISAHVKRGGKP